MEKSSAPCRTFNRKDLQVAKTRITDFSSQLLGTVKVRSREVSRMVRRIAVLAGVKICRNDFAKLRIAK